MTRDDIIQIAKSTRFEYGMWQEDGMARFADRIANAERIAILKIVELVDTPETRRIAYAIKDRMKK